MTDMREALKGLVDAVERDSRENNSISGYTGARLSDARAALAAPGEPVAWLIHWSDIGPQFTKDRSEFERAVKVCAKVECFYASPRALGVEEVAQINKLLDWVEDNVIDSHDWVGTGTVACGAADEREARKKWAELRAAIAKGSK